MEKITEIAERIAAMRDLCGFTTEEMAEATGVSVSDYEDAQKAVKAAAEKVR